MKPTKPDADEYSRSTKGLADYGELLKGLIGALLSVHEIKPHSITFRVKQQESAYKKISSNPEKYHDFRSLTDLLGIRIISYFSDEVDRISNILESEFEVDVENSIDKRATLAPNTFGYMSVHYILTMSKDRCRFAEYTRYAGIPFEVQVRSVLQHAWAEIEHDLGYKATREIPSQFRRVFSRIAGTLEGADEEFVRMRDALLAYESEIQQSMARSFAGIEVNAKTIEEFIRQSETLKRIDEMVAAGLGTDMREGFDRQGLKAALTLPKLDLNTIEEIEQALVDYGERLPSFAKLFNSHPKVISGSNVSAGKGVSLDFLAYYLIGIIPDEKERVRRIQLIFPKLGEPDLLDSIILESLNSDKKRAS